MYLNLGQEVILQRDLIGIFDLDSATVAKRTRDFLSDAQKAGEVTALGDDLPRTFLVACKKGETQQKIYISQLSNTTLLKRAKEIF
ncbi:MAG: DUF370 domain-containing protein [Clostridia bacterium]|nr:DUF370 domain-containing protein [Clostridia bacterium]